MAETPSLMPVDLDDLPEIVDGALHPIDVDLLAAPDDPRHPPRILLLYGSLREVSYSRKAAEEAARVLRALGCETQVFDPSGLPLVDDEGAGDHPKVQELRSLALWSEGMVWSSPERHGAMTGIISTRLIRCAFWAAGCAWSRSPTNRLFPRLGLSLPRGIGCLRGPITAGSLM